MPAYLVDTQTLRLHYVYVAWHVVRFVYDVSVCFVKETLRQGLDRSCSWINQPEDLTSRKLLGVCPGRNPATFRLMAPGCDCWVACRAAPCAAFACPPAQTLQ